MTTPTTSRKAERRLGRRALGLLLLVAALFLAGVVVTRIHGFLAPTETVDARYLVVEGWLPDYAIEAAAGEYRRGAYQRIFTTGGPLERGSLLLEHATYAGGAAATFRRLNLESNLVVAVSAPLEYRNRTFASAIALRRYCETNDISLQAINLVSLGAHARRSQLCFQRALGDRAKVGVLAVENRDYDARRWWRTSEGLKTVCGEALAYGYAWLRLDYGK